MNSPLTLRFAIDSMLGRLARHLLHCGYDCFYRDDIPDDDLAGKARRTNRIILTRDRDFIRKSALDAEVYVLKSDSLRNGLTNLRQAFGLTFHREFFFTRCSDCNEPLTEVGLSEVRDVVPEETAKWIDRYYRCDSCRTVYWKGSHHEDLTQKLREWNLLDAS